MHFLPQLSDFVPLRNGFNSFRAQTDQHHPVDSDSYIELQGESPTYILNEDTQPAIRAIGVSHTAYKDVFRQNIRSHSWSVFSFFIIFMYV